MANNEKENKIKKFTKEAIGKTLNQFNKEIGMTDLVEINKNQDRILNGILSQVNDENTEKTEKSNIITLDNSTDGIVELKEIQGDTNVNVSKIVEETPITHVIEDKEGNVITLNEIPKGAISIGEIQGNTMVNCNKDDKKELILMEDLSTEGYSNITLNKGVNGGKVDVTLEGNTMVNVCDQKDPVAITKSYTVETGNHVALQGEYDGKCRPVVTGNTLVNLSSIGKTVLSSGGNNKATTCEMIKPNTTYTTIINIKSNTLLPSNTSGNVGAIDVNNGTASTNIASGQTGIIKKVFTTNEDISSYTYIERVRVHSITTEGSIEIEAMLLEGDYTNKPIPGYFEGLQSSFEDKVVPENLCPNVINDNFTITGVHTGNACRKDESTNTWYLDIGTCTSTIFSIYRLPLDFMTVGKTYTFKFDCSIPIKSIQIGITDYISTSNRTISINNDVYTFTLKEEDRYIVLGQFNSSYNPRFTISNPMLLEGDYSNFYFSDYDLAKAGKYKVDYVITSKNKFDKSKLVVGGFNTSTGVDTDNPNACRTNFIKLEPATYKLTKNTNQWQTVIGYDNKFNYSCIIYDGKVISGTFTIPETVTYVRFKFDYDIDTALSDNIQLEEGSTSTPYEPYKEYKKTFYLNSPLLEGDTIEQQGDNVVHVHRYGKVVLDGSDDEGWFIVNSSDNPYHTNTSLFVWINNDIKASGNTEIMYCDKLVPRNVWNQDVEGIQIENSNNIRLSIDKSKLSTDDVAGFKQYLQSNPITIAQKLNSPQYEVISQNDTILCDSYVNGHLDIDSVVPIERVVFEGWKNNLKYLYPNTNYVLQFESDNIGILSFNLGSTLLNQSIVKGINKFNITTPASMTNTDMFFTGIGFNASNIVVTEAIEQDFGYFEGMKSVGECEDLEVVSINKNLWTNDLLMSLPGVSEVQFDGKNCITYDRILSGNIAFDYNFKPNTQYTFRFNNYYSSKNGTDIRGNYMRIIYTDGTFESPRVTPTNETWYTHCLTSRENKTVDRILFSYGYNPSQVTTYTDLDSIQIEEGSTATDYIPHQSNKKQLTHEPLRAVGNVKDRYTLIDGKWFIERNCKEVVLDGSEPYWSSTGYGGHETRNTFEVSIDNIHTKIGILKSICDTYIVSEVEDIPKKDDVYRVYSNGTYAYFLFTPSTSIIPYRDTEAWKEYLSENPITIIVECSPSYEQINYNPLVTYSDITHITTNSAIPTNITIKNHGFNCLLKPSTTYTVSSNRGINTVTTGADIGDSCLRFYNEDTSNITTMRDVLILEGDWTSKADLIPSNFSGIKSVFEQELVTDENNEYFGKYKVVAKIIGKNLFDESSAKVGYYWRGDNILATVENSIASEKYLKVVPGMILLANNQSSSVQYMEYDSNKNFIQRVNKAGGTSYKVPNNVAYLRFSFYASNNTNFQIEQVENECVNSLAQITPHEPYKESDVTFYIDEPLRGVEDSKDRIFIQGDKVIVERNCGSEVFDGSDDEGWAVSGNPPISNSLSEFTKKFSECKVLTNLISNNFSMQQENTEGFKNTSAVYNLRLFINKVKLQTEGIEGFRQWLQQNPVTVVYQLAEPTYEEVEYSSNRLILDTFNNESFNNSTLFLDTNISPKLSFKPLWEELVYVKNSTKYYIQFNAVGSGEVVINLGGTELTTEIVEGYNCIPITTPSESTNLMTISGQGITISEVVVSEVVYGGYYKGLQSCFEEHMENGKYRVLLRGIALDGSKVNGIKLYINEPLRGIGDTKDRLCIKNGKLMVERRCGEFVLDEKATWGALDTSITPNNPRRFTGYFKDINASFADTYNSCPIITDRWETVNNDTDVPHTRFSYSSALGYGILWIYDPITRNAVELQQYLGQNPVTVVYQLAEPTYEEATNEYGLPIVFEGYENGIVYIDSAVTPTTHIKYTSNNQLATTLAEAEEQNITTQEDINMNVITYMMDIDMILTDMEMSNDISVMAVRRDNSNENMLDRMSDEDKKVYRDNTVVMLEKMITANVLDKEDIEGRIDMYYNKNRISKEQYEYLKSLL